MPDAAEPSAVGDGAIPEPVRAAWQRVVDGWDEPARHDALVGLVALHDCYAWAAARYRGRAGDPIADAQLERLRRTAIARLVATATVRPDATAQPYRTTIAILIALVILAGVGVVYALVRDNQRAAVSTPARH